MSITCQVYKNSCRQNCEYLIITSCEHGHLEETPLCEQHLHQWYNQIQHPNPIWLACNDCGGVVIEQATTTIDKLTPAYRRTLT